MNNICVYCGKEATHHEYPDNQPFSIHFCDECYDVEQKRIKNMEKIFERMLKDPESIDILREQIERLKR